MNCIVLHLSKKRVLAGKEQDCNIGAQFNIQSREVIVNAGGV